MPNHKAPTPLKFEHLGKEFVGAEAQLNMWHSHFTKILQNSKIQTTDKYSTKNCFYPQTDQKFTFEIIKTAIDTVKKIPKFWLLVGDTVIEALVIMFNTSLRTGYLPEQMRTCHLSPIPKNGKKNYSYIKSWRPIQIQNCISKILEKATLLIFSSSSLFKSDNYQFGYKNRASTNMPLKLLHAIKGRAFAGVLDMTSAFDLISWDRVLLALEKRNLDWGWIRLFHASFKIRVFIKWRGLTTTEPILPRQGVKQGGLFSPFLFSICMDILAQDLKKSAYGVHISTEYSLNLFTNVFIYADDILILARSKFALRQLLTIVVDFCESFEDLDINETKSCIIVLNNGRKKWEEFCITVKSATFKAQLSTEYLGVIIGDLAAKILKMKTSLYIRANILKRSAINSCSVEVKRNIYEAYSPVYGLTTLTETSARKVSPSLRYLAQVIFKKESLKYQRSKSLDFIRNRDLFKFIPYILKLKPLNTICEQWRISNYQIGAALNSYFT